MTSRKDDIGFHYVLKQAAIYSYRGNNSRLPHGYRVIESVNNDDNGFYADVLSDGDNIIIAYRGTEISSPEDLENDYYMLQKKLPMQTIDALKLYDKVERVYPNKTISLTGHSLGGSLAEIVSGIRGAFAVTFNAYGIRDMFKSGTILKEDNIINYVNEWDPVSMKNAENLIGKTYAVNYNKRRSPHDAESMEFLFNRELRTTEELKKHKNILNRAINRTKYLGHQITNTYEGTLNSDKPFLQSQTGCIGSYPVSGYTRSDGTKVDGYIRTCGAKHNN